MKPEISAPGTNVVSSMPGKNLIKKKEEDTLQCLVPVWHHLQ
jgi:hypothetical protein